MSSKYEAINKNIFKIIKENLRSNSQLSVKPPVPPIKTRLKYRNISKDFEIKKEFVGTIDGDILPKKAQPSPMFERANNKSSFITTRPIYEENKKYTNKTFSYNLFQIEKDKKKASEKLLPKKKVKSEKNLHLKEIISSTSSDITQFILPLLHFSSKCGKRDNINSKYNNLLQTFNEVSIQTTLKPIDEISVKNEIIPKVPPRLNFFKKLTKKLHQDSSTFDSLTNITPTNINYTIDKSLTNLNDSQMTLKSASHHNHTNLEILKKEIDKTINDLSTIQTEVTNRIQQNARSLNQANIIVDSACNTDISMCNAVFTIKYDHKNTNKSFSEDTALNSISSTSSGNNRTKSLSTSLSDKIHLNNQDIIYSNTKVKSGRSEDSNSNTIDDSSFTEMPNYINNQKQELNYVKYKKQDNKEISDAKENLRSKLEKEINKRILEKVANTAIKQLDSDLEQIKSFNLVSQNNNKIDDIEFDKNVNPLNKNKKNGINDEIMLRLMPLKRTSIPKYSHNLPYENRTFNDISSDYRKSYYNENVCFASKTDVEYSSDISNSQPKKIKTSLNNSLNNQLAGPIRVIKDARNKFKNTSTIHSGVKSLKNIDSSCINKPNIDFRRPHSYVQIENSEMGNNSNNSSIKRSNETQSNNRPTVKIVNKSLSKNNLTKRNDSEDVEIKIIHVKDIEEHLEKKASPVLDQKEKNRNMNYYEIPITYSNKNCSQNDNALLKSTKDTLNYKIRYPSASSSSTSDNIDGKFAQILRTRDNNDIGNKKRLLDENGRLNNDKIDKNKNKISEIYFNVKNSLLIEEQDDIENLIETKKNIKQNTPGKKNLIHLANYENSLIRLP